MAAEIKPYEGKALSRFRTFNKAALFSEIKSASDASEAFRFAEKSGLKAFVLGGGSNVFFRHSEIKSYILKNALEPSIKDMGADLFEVSSSVRMIDLLKFLYKEGRDGPYYLASAPCQIGGAIAMNAGSGPREKRYVFDFLKSVKFARADGIFEKDKSAIFHAHRRSEFSGTDSLIVSAVFKFPKRQFFADPIKERLDWAKKNQDLSVPNCGSLCNKYDARLMKIARFIFSPFPAGMSKKKLNWAYNKAGNPIFLRMFLWTLKTLHKIFGKEIKFEIKFVD